MESVYVQLHIFQLRMQIGLEFVINFNLYLTKWAHHQFLHFLRNN